MTKETILKIKDLRFRVANIQTQLTLLHQELLTLEFQDPVEETAFIFDRPKTCTKIEVSDIEGNIAEIDVCPADLLQGIKPTNPLDEKYGKLIPEMISKIAGNNKSLLNTYIAGVDPCKNKNENTLDKVYIYKKEENK